MKENEFQSELIKELRSRFPGCIILKNDPNYIQGFPDLTVLYNDSWAVLECKRKSSSRQRMNQKYYVDILDSMSFSKFINPENKEEVLNDLQQAFEHGRTTRLP